jgi:hypothetical protein
VYSTISTQLRKHVLEAHEDRVCLGGVDALGLFSDTYAGRQDANGVNDSCQDTRGSRQIQEPRVHQPEAREPNASECSNSNRTNSQDSAWSAMSASVRIYVLDASHPYIQ